MNKTNTFKYECKTVFWCASVLGILPVRANSDICQIKTHNNQISTSVQFSHSVVSDSATPGFPVHHQLLEFTQTQVHLVGDTILPLSSPSPTALNLAQHQCLFQWVSSLYQVAKVLELQFQSTSPSNEYSGLIFLGLTGLISLKSKGPSRVFSSTTIQRCQFFSAQPSLWSHSHIRTWQTGKTIALITRTSVGKVMSLLFNMLSRFVIPFLPRSQRLLISWMQSPSTVT